MERLCPNSCPSKKDRSGLLSVIDSYTSEARRISLLEADESIRLPISEAKFPGFTDAARELSAGYRGKAAFASPRPTISPIRVGRFHRGAIQQTMILPERGR